MVTGEYEDAKEEMEDISEFIAQSRPEWNKPSPDVIIKKSR
jgi:hypothetical protein